MALPHALTARKTRPAIILFVVAVAAIAWWLTKTPGGESAFVTGSGTIEAEEIALGAEIGGRVAALAVDEGAQVRTGDLLVSLDTTMLDAQVRQTEAARDLAQANLSLIQQGAREEEVRQAEGAVAQATALRDAAKSTYDNAQAVREDPQDLNLRIETARAQKDAAQASLDKLKRGATEFDLTAAQADVTSATGNLTAAQARLDLLIAGPTADQIAEAEAAVRTARNQLYATQAQADATLGSGALSHGTVVYTEDVKKAQSGVAYEQINAAEARLAQLKDPARPESVKQAEGSRDQAQAALDAAQARLARMKAGATDEELRVAEANARQARANLDGLLAMRDKPLSLNSQVDAARGQYQAAEGALQTAQARLDAVKNGATDQQVQASQAQLRQAEAALSVLEAQRDKAVLRAPADGVVAKKNVHVGETVAPFARLLTLTDLDTVTLTVYVPETKIGRVILGQKVEIAVDSFPGRSFDGEVTYISPQAEFTPRNVQSQKERTSTVFGVKVRLLNPEHLLKPGMPADARIEGGG